MLKSLKDQITLSGTVVLMIGVALLVFTFASAYGFLAQGLSILAAGDLVQIFGEALGPLISTCIRVMYLGVMAWIGSLLTIRGVTILSQARQMPPTPTQTRVHEQPQEIAEEQSKPVQKAKKEKELPEAKHEEPIPYEPEIVVLTPEKVPPAQEQGQSQKPQQNQQQPQGHTENK